MSTAAQLHSSRSFRRCERNCLPRAFQDDADAAGYVELPIVEVADIPPFGNLQQRSRLMDLVGRCGASGDNTINLVGLPVVADPAPNIFPGAGVGLDIAAAAP